jgi:hypothetical protein
MAANIYQYNTPKNRSKLALSYLSEPLATTKTNPLAENISGLLQAEVLHLCGRWRTFQTLKFPPSLVEQLERASGSFRTKLRV